MFNLKIQTTEQITTDDLEIFVGELPLIFEAVGNIPGPLQDDLLTWSRADYPLPQTLQLVPRLFLSVSQNGDPSTGSGYNTYPLTSQAEAEALRAAVGEDLLRDIVEGYWNYRYRFFKRKRLASANSSTEAPAMNGSEPTP